MFENEPLQAAWGHLWECKREGMEGLEQKTGEESVREIMKKVWA